MMEKYDLFYDILFEDEEFLNVLYKFHSNNWKNLDAKGRDKVIKSFIEIYCDRFNIDKVSKYSLKGGYQGVYFDLVSSIYVKDAYLKDDANQYDLIDTLFHELRHNFQRRAVAGYLTKYEYVSDNDMKAWELNLKSSPAGYSNYIGASGEKEHLYLCQPVEIDAFKHGLLLTRKTYDVIRKKIEDKDPKFTEYCVTNEPNIMYLFSNEKIYAETRVKHRKELYEFYRNNNKVFDLENKCMSIAEPILSKKEGELTLEEMETLFSSYVWASISIEKKIEILKRYDELTNDIEPVKIEKAGNTGVKVGKFIFESNYIHSVLNAIFSCQCIEYADAIVDGKIECNSDIKEDLIANLYIHKGKEINFLIEEDNQFEYSIQPYALFEADFINEKLDRLKKRHYEVYGVEDKAYDVIKEIYNYKKMIPFIENFYGKPFKQVYDKLVRRMKNNIEEIKEEKIKTSMK